MGMEKDIRLFFLGDSFVNGTGDETMLGWTGRLAAEAAATGAEVTYYNLGIRRNTSADILARWQHECRARFIPGVDNRLVVSFGVNDCIYENGRPRVEPEASVANLKALLSEAMHAFNGVLFISPSPIDDAEITVRIEALHRMYETACGELGSRAIHK